MGRSAGDRLRNPVTSQQTRVPRLGTGNGSVVFPGGALDDLRAFPAVARRGAGHQIDQVQSGRDPDDWRPMNTAGPGVREIRIRDSAGAFWVMYTTKFADAVYVLHCFQKTTQKTSKADIDLAANRCRDLARELGR